MILCRNSSVKSVIIRRNPREGVTLIEVLLASAILAIIAAASILLLVNFRRNVELEEGARQITDYLRRAQAQSMTGELYGGEWGEWGVHFENQAVGGDFFVFYFTTSTYAGRAFSETVFLTSLLGFVAPPVSNSTDIQFTRLAGAVATTTSIVIAPEAEPANSKTITVTQEGTIQFE